MNEVYFSLSKLFEQLGLPTSNDDIEHFLETHCLDKGQALADAEYWNESQAQFIREAIEHDSDWAESVDHLAARLSKPR